MSGAQTQSSSARRCSSPRSARRAGRCVCRPRCATRSSPSTTTPGWSLHMPDTAADQAVLAGSAPVHDLSVVTLFLQADNLVKLVMLLLLCASFWSWAVIFDKFIKLRRLRRDADTFEESFWSGGALDDLYDRIGTRPEDPMSSVFAAAMREWRRSMAKGLAGSSATRMTLQERIERVMQVTAGREMARIERYMPFLATVGSTSPFVGLFGTVWGIMNSFSSIAAAKNTSLSVVAPGIAEALFATALGLVAAIPAVIFYNKFSTDFSRYAGRLEAFGTEFSAILSRQLDEKVH